MNMKIINEDLAEKWKNESINTAKEMNLFSENIIKELERVPLLILYEYPPKDLNEIFGHVGTYFYNPSKDIIIEGPHISIYYKNYSNSFDEFFGLLKKKGVYDSEIEKKIRNLLSEDDIFEIYNQSGMDHELLGHIGNKLIGKNGDEKDACVTQYVVANYRGKTNKKWEFAAEFIRYFQTKHRGVPLEEYKPRG